jgi:hypothetical protein
MVYKKKAIPRALREQVWIQTFGEIFKSKCKINWCENIINVFNFQVGHNIPESKSGETVINNLIPLCSRCNQSMGNKYTIDEFNSQFDAKKCNLYKEGITKRPSNCYFNWCSCFGTTE